MFGYIEKNFKYKLTSLLQIISKLKMSYVFVQTLMIMGLYFSNYVITNPYEGCKIETFN